MPLIEPTDGSCFSSSLMLHTLRDLRNHVWMVLSFCALQLVLGACDRVSEGI